MFNPSRVNTIPSVRNRIIIDVKKIGPSWMVHSHGGTINTEMVKQVVAADGSGKLFEEQLGMHPIGRIGEPEEIGATAVFLASDGGAFANGADFRIDGGLTITPRMKPGAGSSTD